MHEENINFLLASFSANRVEGRPEYSEWSNKQLTDAVHRLLLELLHNNELSKDKWEVINRFLAYLGEYFCDSCVDDIPNLLILAQIFSSEENTGLDNIQNYRLMAFFLIENYKDLIDKMKEDQIILLNMVMSHIKNIDSDELLSTIIVAKKEELLSAIFSPKQIEINGNFIAEIVIALLKKLKKDDNDVLDRLKIFLLSNSKSFPEIFTELQINSKLVLFLYDHVKDGGHFFKNIFFEYCALHYPHIPIKIVNKYWRRWKVAGELLMKKNLDLLEEIYQIDSSIPEKLYSYFGIIHLGRYPSDLLLRQIAMIDNEKIGVENNCTLVCVATAYDDHNGVFRNGIIEVDPIYINSEEKELEFTIKHLAGEEVDQGLVELIEAKKGKIRQHIPEKMQLIYFEGLAASLFFRIAKVIERQGKNARKVIYCVGVHGKEDKLFFSNSNPGCLKQSVIDRLCGSTSFVAWLRSIIPTHTTMVMCSCSTGRTKSENNELVTPIAQSLSRLFGITVTAPDAVTGAEVTFNSDGNLVPSYPRARAIMFHEGQVVATIPS